jgi:hypothetical protein
MLNRLVSKRKAGSAQANQQCEKEETVFELRKKLEAAYQRFNMELDGDLIESAIYEIAALEVRYSHLLKKIRDAA